VRGLARGCVPTPRPAAPPYFGPPSARPP
jgi:hypothetical protein